MRWTSLAVVGIAATGSATTDESGAVIDLVKPNAPNPTGCQTSYPGKFNIEVEALSQSAVPQGTPTQGASPEANARSDEETLDKREPNNALAVELKNSVMTDAKGRTGYIASNYQLQFDGPPQAGTIYSGGFCISSDSSLVLGDSAVFYRCKSGDFYNIYNRNLASQCDPVRIRVAPIGGASGPAVGQKVATGVKTMVQEIADGQPQVISTQVPVPICQIGDGQIQAHTTPCADMPTAVSPAVNPVSQISDGQPQAPYEITTAPQVSPTPAPSSNPAPSLPSFAMVTSPTAAPVSPTQASNQQHPAAPSSSATFPVQAGAKMTAPGIVISLIAALAGFIAFIL